MNGRERAHERHVLVLLVQVLEHLPALPEDDLQAPCALMVFPVLREVVAQLFDSAAPNRDLCLGGPRILLIATELGHDRGIKCRFTVRVPARTATVWDTRTHTHTRHVCTISRSPFHRTYCTMAFLFEAVGVNARTQRSALPCLSPHSRPAHPWPPARDHHVQPSLPSPCKQPPSCIPKPSPVSPMHAMRSWTAWPSWHACFPSSSSSSSPPFPSLSLSASLSPSLDVILFSFLRRIPNIL